MKVSRIPASVFVVALAAGLAPAVQAQQSDMSFFVTSVGKGNGADLGGLDGADAYCNTLAKAAGSNKSNWRAYLSTQAATPSSAEALRPPTRRCRPDRAPRTRGPT